MSNIPTSLTDSTLIIFKLTVYASHPWPFSAYPGFLYNMLHHHGRREVISPKGCMAITVGQGAEQQRFVIPVEYVNHPRFICLLKEAEEEYGFRQEGVINIPCHVEEFCEVRSLIDKETSSHHHHHHHHHLLCSTIFFHK